MVTNLNLSYFQELGLLETHHFHLHPALCWERQSTWPDEGFVLLWDTALSQVPELPTPVASCGTVTITDTAQVPVPWTLSHTQLGAFLCCKHSKPGHLSSLHKTSTFFQWDVSKICPTLSIPRLGRCADRSHVCRNQGGRMLLQFIHISSQSQPRMNPHKTAKAAAHPRVPHRGRDTAATQLCHCTWLWMNLSSY